MKQVKILIVFLFVAMYSYSQLYTPTVPTIYGKNENRIKINYALGIPLKTSNELNTSETGPQIFIRGTDFWYYVDGIYYKVAKSDAVSGGAWGSITGTLTDQTDLVYELNLKQDLLSGSGLVKSTSGTITYIDDHSSDWSTAVSWGNHALAGYLTSSSSLSWAKITGVPTTIGGYGITDYNSLWDTRLSLKSTDNLSEGSNLYYTNSRGIGSNLTGYTSGAGIISSSDNILQAIQKLNGNIGSLITGVSSFNGRTGAITPGSSDYNTSQISEVTNLYYTDARARLAMSAGTGISYNNTTGVFTNTITQYTDALARAAHSLTTTGSGAATYNSSTGVFNIPTPASNFWALTGTSSLTGAATITGSFITPFTYNGTFTNTANNQAFYSLTPSTTLRATIGDNAKTLYIGGTYTKTATSQTATGIEIAMSDGGSGIGSLYGIKTNSDIIPSADNLVNIGFYAQSFRTLYMSNTTGTIYNSRFYSWNTSLPFTWNYAPLNQDFMRMLPTTLSMKIGYNINSTDSLYNLQVKGDVESVGSIHIEKLKPPVISTVTPSVAGGSASITYKAVARTVDGRTSEASNAITTNVSQSLLGGGNGWNAILLSAHVDGAYYIDLYRTVSTGTSGNTATTGLVATYTGRGTYQNILDNGAVGNSASPPTINNTGTLGIGIERPQASIHVINKTEQARTGYDDNNYETKTVASNGSTTYDLVGTSPTFIFSKATTFSSTVNKLTLTAPATGATLALADNSSLNTSGANSLTLTTTGTTNVTLPAGTVSIPDYYESPEYAYTESISWTGTAPTTAANRYRYVRTGKNIIVYLWLNYTGTPGVGVTVASCPFPSGLPTPVEPTGFTSTNANLYFGTGGFATSTTASIGNNSASAVVKTGSGTYAILIKSASGAYNSGWATVPYVSQ